MEDEMIGKSQLYPLSILPQIAAFKPGNTRFKLTNTMGKTFIATAKMPLNRRNALIGLGTLAVGGGVLSATGAFTQVEAERTVEVQAVGDADALLGLEESGIGVGSDVVSETDGLLTIDFGATGADGINLDGRTTVGALDDDASPGAISEGEEAFLITNNGSESIDVGFDIAFHENQSGLGDPGDILKLYTDVSGVTGTIDGGDFENLVAHDIDGLGAGDSARVVIQVDTTGLDGTDIDVESPLFDSTATISAIAQ